MKANELGEAEGAFSLAIEGQKKPPPAEGGESRAADTAESEMRAAYHRERGKVRQLLRDFDGARQGI